MMTTSPTEREIFYQALTIRIRILILIVSFFPMLLTTGILFYKFNQLYTEKMQTHTLELVKKHSQEIDTFLMEKLGNIKYVAHQFDDTQPPLAFLKYHLEALRNKYGDVFTDLGLVNQKGIQFAYEGPFKLENADYSLAHWFINATQRPYYISDVFAGLRGYPHFIISVRIASADASYVLRATVNFGAFNSLVENIHIGKTGVAFILNTKGQLQTKTEVALNRSFISFITDQHNYQDNDTVFTRQQDDVTGKKYLCVASMLRHINWVMVFRQDLNDAFSELWKTQLLTLVIFIAGCIAILSVALILPKSIVRRLSSADEKNEAMNQQVVESGRLATIGELAAGIAHEINNPVAIMIEEAGWMEDLMEEKDESEKTKNMDEFKRSLKQINTQGKRCKEITHKLLSFARKTDSTINDVQINDTIMEIVSLTAQMAKYNNVLIKTILNKDIPYIRISPSEMQQVILNLINNAIDAMEKTGGTITIETKISQIEANHLVITIEDDGPGIPKNNLDRIFDPFFTTKAVGKGTGLGLSICYGIIQKMGGKIDVSSQVGAGTRFRIWIPFQEEITENT